MASPPQHMSGRELERLIPSPSTSMIQQGPVNAKIENAHVDNGSKVALSSTKDRIQWTPFYLRPTTLVGFTILYLVLLLGVVALAVADAKHNGISTAKSSQHHLWTFGPTIVLVIVAALWNQVEHRAKQIMPWKVLQQRPTPASKTLLLDYLTPSWPEALSNSLRSSHWSVAIAITNSLLIKLLTVASTGLLVLQKTPIVRHDCHLTALDEFVDSFNTSKIGSAPVLATLAIQNGTVPFPPGTSRDVAFQQLEIPGSLSSLANAEVEGLASSFHAGLECEVATVKSGASGCSDWQCHGFNTTIDIISPTCEIIGFNYTNGCGLQLEPISCDIKDAWGIGCDSHTDGHEKNRLVFMIGEMKQDLNNQKVPTRIVADNTTTILCEPKYNITSTEIRMDQNGNLRNTTGDRAAQNPSQPFPAWDLVDGLHTSTQAAGLTLQDDWAYTKWSSNPWAPFWTLFDLWARAAYPSSSLKDTNILESRVNELFAMSTAQMAKHSLMRTSTIDSVGTCYGTEDRLRIRGISLYLMGASLVLLLPSTICLLYTAPRNCVSHDPGSIGGLALVLSQSPSLLSRLSNYGPASLEAIKHELQDTDCQSFFTANDQEWQFSVDLTSGGDAQDTNGVTENLISSKTMFWRPLSLLPTFKISVIALLLVLVAILEIVYSVSQRHSGIAEVDPQGYVRFAWAYVPAIVMLTMQTLIGMLTFSSLLIFPHFLLQKRSSNIRNDMFHDYVSRTAIECLWKSVVNRHLPVLCIALAMILTPLLTVAVSGLYVPRAISTEIPLTLSVENQLNSSFLPNDLGLQGEFAQVSTNIGLLLTQNYTYPPWTYDGLAFPSAKLEIPGTFPANSSTLFGSNVTATLPGIRSDLNCRIAPIIPKNFSDLLPYGSNVTVAPYKDAGCDSSQWPSPGSSPFGFFSAVYGYAGSTLGNQFCGAFGLSETNWTAFACSSIINELDVEITMDASTLVILTAKPNESTSRIFSNQTLGPSALSGFPSVLIPSLFGSANFAGTTAGYYDPAFQAVIYESGTTDNLDDFPMALYMDDDGFNRIISRLQHVNRIVTAQAAVAIRMPLDPTFPLAPPRTVNATLRNPHVYRLQQNAVSTRILDGLLVAIALCIALLFGLMDTRNILPKNPTSIAAGASLIASNIVHRHSMPQETNDLGKKVNKIGHNKRTL